MACAQHQTLSEARQTAARPQLIWDHTSMEVLATFGVLLGGLVVFLAGMAVQSARQAVKAYRTTKAGLPKQRKDASSAETRGAVWLLAIMVYALLVLVFLVRANAE